MSETSKAPKSWTKNRPFETFLVSFLDGNPYWTFEIHVRYSDFYCNAKTCFKGLNRENTMQEEGMSTMIVFLLRFYMFKGGLLLKTTHIFFSMSYKENKDYQERYSPTLKIMLSVVYFDQHLGVVHCKCWSQTCFFNIFCAKQL